MCVNDVDLEFIELMIKCLLFAFMRPNIMYGKVLQNSYILCTK